jgi:hypothetical protein
MYVFPDSGTATQLRDPEPRQSEMRGSRKLVSISLIYVRDFGNCFSGSAAFVNSKILKHQSIAALCISQAMLATGERGVFARSLRQRLAFVSLRYRTRPPKTAWTMPRKRELCSGQWSVPPNLDLLEAG